MNTNRTTSYHSVYSRDTMKTPGHPRFDQGNSAKYHVSLNTAAEREDKGKPPNKEDGVMKSKRDEEDTDIYVEYLPPSLSPIYLYYLESNMLSATGGRKGPEGGGYSLGVGSGDLMRNMSLETIDNELPKRPISAKYKYFKSSNQSLLFK
ncbi:Hypothetical predicted protein [Pelobates cultripes]|uniref:Uncharacterized protein n=1 Tax=Pelobates cultripes TaxID=61616 RepID=A0AAD1W3C5_PELCU|nr:Hypothetical predicted protein [Pelobates cultripes]